MYKFPNPKVTTKEEQDLLNYFVDEDLIIKEFKLSDMTWDEYETMMCKRIADALEDGVELGEYELYLGLPCEEDFEDPEDYIEWCQSEEAKRRLDALDYVHDFYNNYK